MSAAIERIINNIQAIMDDRGITQTRLAELSGMPQPQLAGYLNKRNKPGVDKVEAIASALGVTFSQLLGDKPPRKPTPEEFAAAFIEGYPLEPKRKRICLLALTAEANLIDPMHDTSLSAYFKVVEGRAPDNKKPSVG